VSTVLIVDDELAIAEALALILADEGYSVVCASNGRQGLERIAQAQPDAVILDFVMPVMSGAEFGRRVAELYPNRAFRIIMNSSIAEESVRQSFDGYDVFIRKPYTTRHLLSVLEAQLKLAKS
jgi:CheY-like chemotaxis protein